MSKGYLLLNVILTMSSNIDNVCKIVQIFFKDMKDYHVCVSMRPQN